MEVVSPYIMQNCDAKVVKSCSSDASASTLLQDRGGLRLMQWNQKDHSD